MYSDPKDEETLRRSIFQSMRLACFIGGGLAPYCASKLAIAFNVSVPFYVAAGSVVIGIGVLATGHALLIRAEKEPGEELVGPRPSSAPTPPAWW